MSSKENGNRQTTNGIFRLEGMFGDELEEATKNNDTVTLSFSKGNVVRGIIIAVDRRFAQAKIIQSDGSISCVKLSYLVNITRKQNSETASTDKKEASTSKEFQEPLPQENGQEYTNILNEETATYIKQNCSNLADKPTIEIIQHVKNDGNLTKQQKTQLLKDLTKNHPEWL